LNFLLTRFVSVLYLLVFSIAVSLAAPVAAGPEVEAQEDTAAAHAPQDNAAHMERFDIGFRYGLSDQRNEEYFRKYEVFFEWYLPWAWRPESGWIIASRLDFTGAALYAAGTTGFLGSIGPGLAVRKKGWIVGMDLGISPAFLSEDWYGKEDLSGHIQFLTHGGISLFPIRNLSVGYEFQHVSNADIEQPNPGLNMHNIEISYRFW
jgi:hypothetical protein